MNLLALFLSFVFSAAITFLMIPKIILISFKKKLFDPVNERKVHSGVVPRLGGVAFAPALIISYALLYGLCALAGVHSVGISPGPVSSLSLTLGLCALMLLYFVGITDDLIGVSYRVKFLVQFLCALLIVAGGVWLDDLCGLFGIHALPGWVGKPLTVLLIVYIVNAVNLIDGIDGLASGLSMVALFFLGSLFAVLGNPIFACVAFSLLGALCPFFYYNVFGRAERHQKIFMGDCGSLVVGLVLGFLAVGFVQTDERAAVYPDALVVAFSVLMIPCLDVARVMLGRLRRGCNPFLPDKTHIHHKFLALGMSHRTAMVTILMLDAFFVLLNLGLAGVVDINLIVGSDVVLFCLLQAWVTHLIRRRTAQQE